MNSADRELVAGDVGEVATLLASIVEIVDTIANSGDESGYLTMAIRPLAVAAHDQLDFMLRAIGAPGLGFKGRAAKWLESERADAARLETRARVAGKLEVERLRGGNHEAAR